MQQHKPSSSPGQPPAGESVGLDPALIRRLKGEAPERPCTLPMSAGELTSLAAENQNLRAEVARLTAERERLLETQRRVMELLQCTSPERIIHDLRNVLNERELFKTLAEVDAKE